MGKRPIERIVIAAALPFEADALCKSLGVKTPSSSSPFTSIPAVGSRCALAILASGVGCGRMRSVLSRLPEQPSLWVSIGVAGGLSANAQAGVCLTGREVVLPDGDRLPGAGEPPSCVENSLLLCTDAPLLTPEAKQQAHHDSGADAVDMESAAVARWASERGEAFGWIKAISDGPDEPLPAELFDCVAPNGFPSIGRALRLLMRKPALTPGLMRMGVRNPRLSQAIARRVLEIIDRVRD
ncbi:MAG: hypothetical protein GC154_14420 [bacterium]|nr:hypothetical protein [bacterium]